MSLSQIELVWVTVRVERVFLSESERRKQGVWIQHGRIQDGWHHQVESEWMSEVFLYKMAESRIADFKIAAIIKLSQNEWVKFFLCKWWEPILASVSEFERKNQDGWIQEGQIQDGCHHQVKWEWMSLSQIEIVWVRVRVKREWIWVNLREDNKVSECKMAVSESNLAEF